MPAITLVSLPVSCQGIDFTVHAKKRDRRTVQSTVGELSHAPCMHTSIIYANKKNPRRLASVRFAFLAQL